MVAWSHVLLIQLSFRSLVPLFYGGSLVCGAGVGGKGGNGGSVHQQSHTTQTGDHNSGKTPCLRLSIDLHQPSPSHYREGDGGVVLHGDR